MKRTSPPRLILSLAAEAEETGFSTRIDAGSKPFVLGRGNEADLYTPDPAASRIHCEITWSRGMPVLRDLDSQTGTYLNDVRVREAVTLREGDEIRICDLRFRVQLESISAPADEAPAEANLECSAPVDPPPASEPTMLPEPPVIQDAPAETILTGPDESFISARGPLEVSIGHGGLDIGRDDACDVTLPSPTVSRFHVRIERRNRTLVVRDLRSANGSYINGARVEGVRRLDVGDKLKIGPYEFTFDGARLVSQSSVQSTKIELVEIGQQVNHRETGKPIWLLQNVSLTILPGEFAGVFGSSGCGKSTLMDVINGRRPAGTGRVLYNGENLYNTFSTFQTGIGHVPQQLILHELLPMEDALRYAARLRLPLDTSDDEINANLERVLEVVGLSGQRTVQIANLSGGQQKRVSIAMELLSHPSVLFLDEATSGLDLITEAEMMQIFRRLADGGVTTLCITHHAHSLHTCDVVIYLMCGRLAYFGPPDQLLEYFEVGSIRDVYLKERERSPEQWEARFKQSAAHHKYVLERSETSREEMETKFKPGEAVETISAEKSWSQFLLLSERYVRVLLNDRRHVLLLLALAPVIAVLARIRFPESSDLNLRTNALCFAASLGAIFLGIFGAIREIVKEQDLYRHERFVNLEIPSYIGSKIAPLAMVNALQALGLLFFLSWGEGGLKATAGTETAWVGLFMVLFISALTGTTLGLALSAAVRTASQAMMLMVLAIIPQILFNNALRPEATGGIKTLSKFTVPEYWSYELLLTVLDVPAKPEVGGLWGSVVLLVYFCGVFVLATVYFQRKKDGPYGKPYVIPLVRSGTWVELQARLRTFLNSVLGGTRRVVEALAERSTTPKDSRRHR